MTASFLLQSSGCCCPCTRYMTSMSPSAVVKINPLKTFRTTPLGLEIHTSFFVFTTNSSCVCPMIGRVTTVVVVNSPRDRTFEGRFRPDRLCSSVGSSARIAKLRRCATSPILPAASAVRRTIPRKASFRLPATQFSTYGREGTGRSVQSTTRTKTRGQIASMNNTCRFCSLANNMPQDAERGALCRAFYFLSHPRNEKTRGKAEIFGVKEPSSPMFRTLAVSLRLTVLLLLYRYSSHSYSEYYY